jgi:hypothetical protein
LTHALYVRVIQHLREENYLEFAAAIACVSSLEVKMEVLFALQEERLDKKLEALKAEMVRWVFLVMLGNVAISATVNALMNSLR